MVKIGLFVRLVAKPGKETAVAQLLKQGLELANQERQTPVWFAVRFDAGTFAVFDAFEDEAGREAHLGGRIAEALMAKASELLAEPPRIERFDALGVKLPG
jgi:quinol monooxygenase YgiN